MNAIQQTAVIDSTRRHLWLDEPLPESVSAGQVSITLLIRSSVPERQPVEAASKDPNRWGRGLTAGTPGGSVDDFLARCREDKERELALEKRQAEEHARYAGTASL